MITLAPDYAYRSNLITNCKIISASNQQEIKNHIKIKSLQPIFKFKENPSNHTKNALQKKPKSDNKKPRSWNIKKLPRVLKRANFINIQRHRITTLVLMIWCTWSHLWHTPTDCYEQENQELHTHLVLHFHTHSSVKLCVWKYVL